MQALRDASMGEMGVIDAVILYYVYTIDYLLKNGNVCSVIIHYYLLKSALFSTKL
jgi:hypothetical protein